MANGSASNASHERLKVRLLGTIDISPNAGGALTRGAREVLAYLVLNGSSRRSKLAAAAWPEVEESQALFYLRRALSELRKNLGQEAERLQSPSQAIIGFDLEGVEVDLFQFQEAIKRQDFDGAFAMYQEEILSGIQSSWAEEHKEAIESEFRRQLMQAGHLAAGMGDSARAMELWRRSIQIKPTDESAWQTLIRTQVREGNIAEAKATLAECEAVMRRKLARGVSTRTRSLVDNLSPASTLDLGPLPPALGEMVGRQDLVADVLADLGQRSLVTLTGVGGVGKTRLALEVARRSKSQFPDGVCFVELAPLSEDRVTDEIAKLLGFRSQGGAPWRVALQALGNRKLLLILDNAEHVMPQVSRAVEEFLTYVPQSSVLVTSRIPIGLANEVRKRMPSLHPSTAYALFCQRARAAHSSFQPSEAAERLCALLDGIPLAIELTAAHAGNVPIHELSEEFARDLALDSPGHQRAGRHETMRAAILASIQAIPEDLKNQFIRLSVFAGGFTLDAAQSVANLTPSKLGTLTDRSLMEFDGARYRILEPVRQLGRELLVEAGHEGEALEKMIAHFAEKAIRLFDGPFLYDRNPELFSKLRAAWTPDDPNLRLCLDVLRSRGEEYSDRSMAIWLQRIWLRVIDHSDEEARAWLPRLEAKAEPFTSRTEAWWWFTVGTYSGWNDELVRGPDLLRRTAARCEELGYRDIYAEIAAAMLIRTLIDPRTGVVRMGSELAVELFQELGQEEQYLYALTEYAERLHYLGSLDEANEIVERVERASRANKFLRSRAVALRILSRRETTLEGKLRLMNEAVTLQRGRGHWAEVHTLRAIARLLRLEGTPQDEIAAWQDCLECAHRIGYRGSVAEAHLDLADAYRRAGMCVDAWRTIATAIEIIVSLGRPVFLNQTIAILSGMALEMGDASCAAAAYEYARLAQSRGELDLNHRVTTHLTTVEQYLRSTAPPPENSVRFSTPDDVIQYAQSQWASAYTA